ncbi:MAG: dicarboxylate/amino acid:cation symporter [Paludibacteraceae bacterium]|nr:dicarboxylate/amino acid:cation symporter [Paludibacteraceae bacterium]
MKGLHIKKIPLFVKVLAGMALGVGLGFILPHSCIRILKTFNLLFSQFLKFIVPLLVIGMVTPALASIGKNAGKMLITVLSIAYISTICAGLFAYGNSTWLFPHYLTLGELEMNSTAEIFKPYFELKIPPLCDVMTALALSFMTGICLIFTKTETLKKSVIDFGEVVKLTIEKAVIPILPIYIFTMICEMTASGQIKSLMGAGVKIILTGVILSVIYLIIQYCIAGAIARKNPLKCLINMLPAYLTAFSICSSSATIPVTNRCCLRNDVSEKIAGFVIPLCSTVHMCGSTIKLAISALAVMYISGMSIDFTTFAGFVMMQGIAAVAAPGVMGGVLMASIGLMESILGLDAAQTTLVMTLYLAFDGYGPACNVTGDGAIALVTERFFGKQEKAV